MYYFIVNTSARSGHASQIWNQIKARLLERRVEYRAYLTERPGHATEIARQLCDKIQEAGAGQTLDEAIRHQIAEVETSIADGGVADGRITLIVVGGDGTFNEVVNGMHHFDRVNLGLIPIGSGNDLGRGLGITSDHPLARLDEILDACDAMDAESKLTSADAWSVGEAAEQHMALMDLGEVTTPEGTRRFTISAGIGVDASVCRQALTSNLKKVLNRFHLGSLTYALLTVKTLFTMPLADGVVSYRMMDGDVVKKRLHGIIFCAAMNHRCEGGGVPMAPDADAFDGLLSVCAVHDLPRWLTFFLFPFLLAGHHTWIRGFDVTDVTEVKVKLRKPMVIHADGEYCGTCDRLAYRVLPGKLRLIL